jgi:hypothetical protein
MDLDLCARKASGKKKKNWVKTKLLLYKRVLRKFKKNETWSKNSTMTREKIT